MAGTTDTPLTVIYWDDGDGKFTVRYDGKEPDQVLAVVTKENSGEWVEAVFKVDDAKLANRGPFGSDISLVNGGAGGSAISDTVFHRVMLQWAKQ